MSDEETFDDRYQQLLDQMSEMYKLHVDEKHAIENTFELKLVNMEKHWISIVDNERKRFGTIRDEKNSEADSSKMQMEKLKQTYESKLEKVSKQMADTNLAWQKEYDRVCDLLSADGKKFEVAIDEQERIQEQQIVNIQTDYRNQLANENTKVAEALNQVGSLKGHIQVLKAAKVPSELDPAKLQTKISELSLKLRNANVKISSLESSLKETDSSLTGANEEISRLKESQTCLEKFRSSLFSQLKDFEVVKSEAVTRADAMEDALKGADLELATLKSQNRSYAHRSQESEMKAKHALNQLLEAKKSLALLKNKHERLVKAISAQVASEPDSRLKASISRLIGTHESEKDEVDFDPVISEIVLQRNALSRKFENSLVNLSRAQNALHVTKAEMIEDNSQLIGILNDVWKIKTEVEAELAKRQVSLVPKNQPVVDKILKRAEQAAKQVRESVANPIRISAPPVRVISLAKKSLHAILHDSTHATTLSWDQPVMESEDSDSLYVGGPINPSNLFPPMPPSKPLHHIR